MVLRTFFPITFLLLNNMSNLGSQTIRFKNITESSGWLSSNYVNQSVSVKDKIYFASEHGLTVWDIKGQTKEILTRTQGLPFDEINHIALDPHQNIWIGSYRGEVAKVSLDGIPLFFKKIDFDSDAPEKCLITGFAFLGKTAWVATNGNGLYQMDIELENESAHPVKPFINQNINALAMDAHQTLWVANDKGLFLLPYNKRKAKRFKVIDEASAIFKIPNENIFYVAGKTKGQYHLYIINQERIVLRVPFPVIKSKINTISLAPDGDIWLGADQLVRYKKDIHQYDLYKKEHGIDLPAYFSCISFVKDRIIVGTTDKGVFTDIDIKTNETPQESVDYEGVSLKIGDQVPISDIMFESKTVNFIDTLAVHKLLTFLQTNPKTIVEISGHTDNIGNPKELYDLSEARVKAVKNWLTERGVAENRIQLIWYGGSKPIASNDTDASRRRNRRVEVRVVRID